MSKKNFHKRIRKIGAKIKRFFHTGTAFTLMELIVVTTILTVLGTMAYFNLAGYIKNSRDAVRIDQLKLVDFSLNVFHMQTGKFPEPENAVNITFSGATLWKQGSFGDTNVRMIGKLSKKPVDIVSETDFGYSLAADKKQYEIAALNEGDMYIHSGFSPQANAFGKVPARSLVFGNYNGKILQVSTGAVDYVISMPTIITTDTTVTDVMDIVDQEKLAFKGFKNLSATYSGSIYDVNGGFEYSPEIIVLFSGDLSDLIINENEWITLLENLQKSYSGTVLATQPGYEEIANLEIDPGLPSKDVRVIAYNLIEEDLKINTPIELTSGETASGAQWVTYDITDGLLDNDTRSITQDFVGNIWFATKKGVSKFNGSMWVSYTEADGLVNKDTRSVIQDSNGDMWFATNMGVSKYDGTTWTDYTKSDGLIDDDVVYIIQEDDGDLWFATKKGVSEFDGLSSWTNYDHTDGLANKIVKVISEDNLGNLWFGTINGVSKFDGTTWKTYNESDGLVDKNVLSVYADSLGNLWFGTINGISKFDGTTWTTYGLSDGLVNKFVQDIFEDSLGNMWFATQEGASMFDGTNWETYASNIGLADNDVQVIYEDAQGSMWFGTKKGVTIYYR